MQQPINDFPTQPHTNTNTTTNTTTNTNTTTSKTIIMPSLSCNEVCPPHLLAQKFNNRAAFLITTHNYEEGISLLTKALKLAEINLSVNKENIPCSCKLCSLEACLIMEQDSFSSIMDSEKEEYHGNNSKHNKSSHPSCYDDGDGDGDDEMSIERDHDDNGSRRHEFHRQAQDQDKAQAQGAQDDLLPAYEKERDGFVYHRPLLVNKHCIDESHFTGITLSLIILFNLALAHHLKAIATIASNTNSSSNSLKVLQQALQLYELAYQFHVDYVQQQMSSSGALSGEYNRSIDALRFTMIVSNNLGEIHRVAGNSAKHEMCLQHLLSAIMYMVDCKLVGMDSAEMDGFYHNVSPIMLADTCAQAA